MHNIKRVQEALGGLRLQVPKHYWDARDALDAALDALEPERCAWATLRPGAHALGSTNSSALAERSGDLT